MGNRQLSLKCVNLSPEWVGRLVVFFYDLKKNKDEFFFSPHVTSEDALNKLANQNGKDLYYLLVEGDQILGYGLLRGWDEGYEIPSLGIAIHPNARGQGLAKFLIDFLHVVVQKKGVEKIRLRVRKENLIAMKLYKKLGYELTIAKPGDEYLTGIKLLTTE